jgi:hypothetical protein
MKKRKRFHLLVRYDFTVSAARGVVISDLHAKRKKKREIFVAAMLMMPAGLVYVRGNGGGMIVLGGSRK